IAQGRAGLGAVVDDDEKLPGHGIFLPCGSLNRHLARSRPKRQGPPASSRTTKRAGPEMTPKRAVMRSSSEAPRAERSALRLAQAASDRVARVSALGKLLSFPEPPG